MIILATIKSLATVDENRDQLMVDERVNDDIAILYIDQWKYDAQMYIPCHKEAANIHRTGLAS